MNQLWTIIFLLVLAAALGIAAWDDRDARKKREGRATAVEKSSRDGE